MSWRGCVAGRLAWRLRAERVQLPCLLGRSALCQVQYKNRIDLCVLHTVHSRRDVKCVGVTA